MAFDFSGLVDRGVNTVVNTALSSAQKYVGTMANTAVGDQIRKSTDKFLNDIGAPAVVRTVIRDINAQIIQAGVGSVTNLMTGIVNGVITSSDLKKFADLDVVQAAIKAGNPLAQDIMNANVLAGVARNVTKEKAPTIEVSSESSPYAINTADDFGLKFSFMFVVEFVFNDYYSSELYFGNNSLNSLIYKFERPKIEIEHEEVNMYNFFTQIPKRVKYGPVSFTAYDDAKSNTIQALSTYLGELSPIFNIDASQGVDYEFSGGLNYANGAMASNFGTIQHGDYVETNSQLDNMKSIFKEIRVYHVYDFGNFVDVYKFFNPKITNLSMDDLNMEDNKVNSISFEFVYDGFTIDVQKLPKDVPAFEDINKYMIYNITRRDVAEGANTRAAMVEHQRQVAKKQAQDAATVDQEAMLQQAALRGEVDLGNDADVEQYLRNKDAGVSTKSASSIPSTSTSSIVSGIQSGGTTKVFSSDAGGGWEFV